MGTDRTAFLELHRSYNAGWQDAMKGLKARGIHGKVKPTTLPTVDGEGEVHFDDYDLMFRSRFGHTKVCLNGLEEIVYGKQSTYIMEEKVGWLVFIEDKKEE